MSFFVISGLEKFHTVFSENGLVAHRDGKEVSREVRNQNISKIYFTAESAELAVNSVSFVR